MKRAMAAAAMARSVSPIPTTAPMSPRRRQGGGGAGGGKSLARGSSLDTALPEESKTASLVLEDGFKVEGFSFGAETSMAGECVFNTGMVGYPEALSDPSYRGQILILTYPLVGNYGVPGDEVDELGLSKFLESQAVQVAGLIVADYTEEYSHWNAKRSLGEWLKGAGIPALFGVDTRQLTKRIRQVGSILGKIEFAGQPVAFEDPNKRNLVQEVTTKEVKVYGKGQSPRILALDCGMKNNIIRHFVHRKKVEMTVVPADFDVSSIGKDYDGLFISNGPGDPTMASAAVESVKWAMAQDMPIFGICLGNQILALAAGAKTYKMKYGNRSMNQPCIDMRTTRCYITPQNHGYAVDSDSLPEGWSTLFMNANDYSNEGIIHESKRMFSVQFHPEAAGGPTDTSFLFDMFIEQVQGKPPLITTVDQTMYQRHNVRKVLLLGSGGLSIGQAGEFDYSGSQAIKALKEERIEVVLINPNIATVQTSKGMADKVYFLPVTPRHVIDILDKEQPDSIIVSMGGQTALNVGCALWEAGELQKRDVRVLGTQIDVIQATEDRELFARKLAEIGEKAALSYTATTVDEAIVQANKIGYPVLVRAAFALGGLGSGFADNDAEMRTLSAKAFASSDQIMIDQDLRGWKEVEYEVVRDCKDNCITVCNMENFDPLGVHTGDSIVVAPSQTLSNSEYFKLRECGLKVIRHLGVVGECNIQYALHPESEEYCIIEVNARLSRSSALASKATGYPLAYVAAKLALQQDLVSLRNSVTKTTTACFEPALDYCVVKMPRFDLKKFQKVSNMVGSSMKSVGEVMAIGRKFEEVFQKACRMLHPSVAGFEAPARAGDDDRHAAAAAAAAGGGKVESHHQLHRSVEDRLRSPDYERVFAVAEAFDAGMSVDEIHALCKIDRWFLSKLKHVSDIRRGLKEVGSLDKLTKDQVRSLKSYGFSDAQIGDALGASEVMVRRKRGMMGITPFVKQIDTLAAEYPAATNYLYMTYNASEDDVTFDGDGIMVLGCGPYCIGSSVEFDWCAVSCVRELRRQGFQAIVCNYNPETVSTDYDESDKLYFEELSFERVVDIYEREHAAGVVGSVGGQLPQNIAMQLHTQGVNVLGTPPPMIDQAEDRHKFSGMLDDLGIDQPPWFELEDMQDKDTMRARCEELGYPVLVRPSYVLSGAAMRVASNFEQLTTFLDNAVGANPRHPVVVSKFIVNAKEVEFDGVASRGKILNYAISEHVENAGVHSGDATLVLPAQKLYVETIRRVKRISQQIAESLQISGPFNIQYMSRDNEVKVIECNLRASRTFPFISKTLDFNFISLATRVMVGLPVKAHQVRLSGRSVLAAFCVCFAPFVRILLAFLLSS